MEKIMKNIRAVVQSWERGILTSRESIKVIIDDIEKYRKICISSKGAKE